MNDLIEAPSPEVVLPALHLGAPTVLGPLTLFPIWTDAPLPEQPIPVDLPHGATIVELESGPSVEWLTATNPGPSPYLLLEGSIVDGGWQHRVLVHSVLVGAGAALDLPVRCVEQGRWQGETEQRIHRRRAPLGIRGATHGVRHGAPGPGRHERRADQGDVWSRVSAYEERYGASSTASLVEVFDGADGPDHDLHIPRPLLGQRGVIVGAAGHPALLELFDHPDTLAQQWEALIDGLLRSTRHVRATQTPTRRARRFVERTARRTLPTTGSAGAGRLAEESDDLVSVQAVAGIGRTLHTTALNVRHGLVLAA